MGADNILKGKKDARGKKVFLGRVPERKGKKE